MKLLERERDTFLNVYKRFPAHINRGEGVFLYDDNGMKYIDMLAGIAVNALGYNHPAVMSALREQMTKPLHLSNYFVQDIQLRLAEQLLSITPFNRAFFSNSGTEAIEGLLKLAKKWGNRCSKDEFIVFKEGFHGRTLGAVSLTGQSVFHTSIGPLLPNIKIVDPNDTDAFYQAANNRTCAVFFEGIAGQGGIRPMSVEMLNAIGSAQKQYDFLIICDEIQTGLGRTGKLFYYENYDFVPDAIAVAKALGGGLPLGAFLVNERLKDVFGPGDHGSTYGGNPMACAAGLAVLNIVNKKEFLGRVVEVGAVLKETLLDIKNSFPSHINEIRGEGLMLGMETNLDNKTLMLDCFAKGLIFNLSGAGSTIRLVPPLIINEEEVIEATSILKSVIQQTITPN